MQFIDQTPWKLSSLKNGSYYTRYINEKRPKIGRKQLFVSYYQCLQRLKKQKGALVRDFYFCHEIKPVLPPCFEFRHIQYVGGFGTGCF